MQKSKTIGTCPFSIGEIPSSYLVSMTYQEQLIYLMKKMQEIIDFANGKMSEDIEIFINNHFNDIMLNAMYDSENELLILYLEEGEN